MAKVHFLNVGDGDCSIIEHNSSRITVFDICNGKQGETEKSDRELSKYGFASPKGNFGMRNHPTNPVEYLESLSPEKIWRFVLSHPDMDHMDGLNALKTGFQICNFWDSGVRRDKPEFSGDGRYKEEDWDAYIALRDDGTSAKVINVKGGSKFSYANSDDQGGGGDGIKILAPSAELVEWANENQDFNDASFVLLYRTANRKIIFGGDSHDNTWEYILNTYKTDVENCDILIAPHHGRHSGRSWEFLDILKPKLTLFGCADSEHLAYEPWINRKLPKITNNQAGNIVIETETDKDALFIYVENANFAEACGCDPSIKNSKGYSFLGAL